MSKSEATRRPLESLQGPIADPTPKPDAEVKRLAMLHPVDRWYGIPDTKDLYRTGE